MSTTTSNYGFIKPEVDGDADLWGAMINNGLDLIETNLSARLSKTGGSLTGVTHVPDLLIGDYSQKASNSKFVYNNSINKLGINGGILINGDVDVSCIVPDRPDGDNTENAANTKFIDAAISEISGVTIENNTSGIIQSTIYDLQIDTVAVPSASTPKMAKGVQVSCGNLILKNSVGETINTDRFNSGADLVNLEGGTGSLVAGDWVGIWVTKENETAGIATKLVRTFYQSGCVALYQSPRIVVTDLSNFYVGMPVQGNYIMSGTYVVGTIVVGSNKYVILNKNTSAPTGGATTSIRIVPRPSSFSAGHYVRLIGYVNIVNTSSGLMLKPFSQKDNRVTYRVLVPDGLSSGGVELNRIWNISTSSSTTGTVQPIYTNHLLPPSVNKVNIGVEAYATSSSRVIRVVAGDVGSSGDDSSYNHVESTSYTYTYRDYIRFAHGDVELSKGYYLPVFYSTSGSGSALGSVFINGYEILGLDRQ